MTNDARSRTGKESSENPQVHADHETPRVSRRQILKGGATIAPVVLTLTSRPAMGAWCSTSAWSSANLSKPPEFCNGRTPGYVKTHPETWAACGLNPGQCVEEAEEGGKGGKGGGGGTCKVWDNHGTAFGDPAIGDNDGFIFAGDIGGTAGLTAMQVLWTLPGSFESFAVAAFWNACSPDVDYALTETEVLNIVNGIIMNGFYAELDSVAAAKEFLEQTMNL